MLMWRPGDSMETKAVSKPEPSIIDAQRAHWEQTFASKPTMFGDQPSYPAQQAAVLFKAEGKQKVLELGGGQGRDSLFLARTGFDIAVVDYSDVGLQELRRKATESGTDERIHTLVHDIRKPLQFVASSFEGVYSHMLYCMALTEAELVALSAEIHRVLVPGGLNVFTVRTKEDAHYGTGIHRGEDMYEVGGFIVHFFDKAKVQAVSQGFEIVSIDNFEEGGLPRKLFLVTLRKST